MNTNADTVIEVLIGIIVVFFFLAALIPPTDTSVRNIESAINGTISGENLGDANAGSGNLTVVTDHPFDNTSAYIIYNSTGDAHTTWYNVTVTVRTGSQDNTVILNVSGPTNSLVNSTSVTIDYVRTDTQAADVAGLPRLAFFVAVVAALVGILYTYSNKSG